MITKKDILLNYLREHNSITQYEAYLTIFDTRLSDTVYRLKKDGYKFRVEPVKKVGYMGITRNFYRYYLEEE